MKDCLILQQAVDSCWFYRGVHTMLGTQLANLFSSGILDTVMLFSHHCSSLSADACSCHRIAQATYKCKFWKIISRAFFLQWKTSVFLPQKGVTLQLSEDPEGTLKDSHFTRSAQDPAFSHTETTLWDFSSFQLWSVQKCPETSFSNSILALLPLASAAAPKGKEMWDTNSVSPAHP